MSKCIGATVAIVRIGAIAGVFGYQFAFAFDLGDHEKITRQAVAEFNRCYPGAISANLETSIQTANRGEDTDVVRKWTQYSHYFNPEKKLAQARSGSDERVANLEADFRSGRGSPAELGAIVHHIQDMASPPHVVPVTHWLTDGFEHFETTVPATAEPCAGLGMDIAATLDYREIHLATAIETLKRVRTDHPEIRRNGQPIALAWANYWAEGAGNGFGQYGFFGNTFGSLGVMKGREYFEISRATYDRFKQSQLRLAIDSTKKALFVFLKK